MPTPPQKDRVTGPLRILNMKESPTMFMKTKDDQTGWLESPTMLLKTKLLILVIPRY